MGFWDIEPQLPGAQGAKASTGGFWDTPIAAPKSAPVATAAVPNPSAVAAAQPPQKIVLPQTTKPKSTGTISAPSKTAMPANSLQKALASLPLGPKILNHPVIKTIGDTFDDSVSKISDSVDSLINWSDHAQPTVGTNDRGEPVDQFGTRTTNDNGLQKAAKGAEAAVGVANLLFLPITAALKGAETVPVVKYPAKALDYGFNELNKGVTYSTDHIIDHLPISDEVKTAIKPAVADVASLIASIYVGKIAAEKGVPIVKDKLSLIKDMVTKDVVKTYSPGKSVYLTPEEVRDVVSGKLSEGEQKDLYTSLGRTLPEIEEDIKNGVPVEIPPTTLTTIVDKPYWSKIKGAFGLESKPEPIAIEGDGKPVVSSEAPKPPVEAPEVAAPEASKPNFFDEPSSPVTENGPTAATETPAPSASETAEIATKAADSLPKDTESQPNIKETETSNLPKNTEDIKVKSEKEPLVNLNEQAEPNFRGQEKAVDNTVVNQEKPGLQSKAESLAFEPKNLESLDTPVATKETGKIVKRSDIAKELSEKLNVPIRRGKFNRARAAGIYKTEPKVVRIKQGGLPVVFHEVGHFLDDQFDFSKKIGQTERTALTREYGKDLSKNNRLQQQEAFAEFLRFKLTGQTEKLASMAPDFSKYFDGQIAKLPEVKDVLDTAAQDFMRWKEQPAAAKVLSHISMGEDSSGSLKDRVTSGLHSMYTMALDELHPLDEFVKLYKDDKLAAEKNPYILARNLRGWIGKADTFLNHGTFGKDYYEVVDGKVKAKFTGKSFSDIIKPIEKEGKMDDLRVYLVAKRAIELADRDIKTGITRNDAEHALEEIEAKNPNFPEVADDLYKYQDSLLNYAKENGLIGESGYAKIKELNQFRVPFYRVMEETRSAYMGGKKVTGNMSSPIKKIRGSEAEIIDPVESIIKDTYAIINAAERNNIGVAMANIAKSDYQLGRLFEKVDKPMQATKVNVREVLEKAMPGMADMIPDELGDQIVTLFRAGQDRGPNMLNVNFGDKSQVFQVEPDLFKAIQGLDTEDIGMIMKILSMPAKILRVGATLSPDFTVRNPLRDQFSAFVYSKYGFKPGIDLVRGLFEVFNKGDVYNLWKMSGGEHSMMVSLDRDYLQSNLKDILKSKGQVALDYVKNPLDALRAVSELGEQATRLGEMRRGLNAGATPTEAAYASREVTLDFARIGAKTKAVNSIIAFWNANVQGLDKMVRSFREKPVQSLAKVGIGITLPSILLYLANRKDPRWKETPEWQKDLFWIVLTKNHIYRIPKPFELGVLFGSVPERMLEFMDNHNPEIFKELEDTVANGATPGFIPTALVPIIENITNYSFFLNRPIVPQGKASLPPEAQKGTYTSEVAKLLGKPLNYSPAKIDNLIQGYSGGLGKYVVGIVDGILRDTGVSKSPKPPAPQLEDKPVIKAFMIRPPVGTNSESVNQVYTYYDKVNGETTYLKSLSKDDPVQAKEYLKSHPEIIGAKTLTEVVDSFSNINNARETIRQSRDLSPLEKQVKIAQLDNMQTDIAEKFLAKLKKR